MRLRFDDGIIQAIMSALKVQIQDSYWLLIGGGGGEIPDSFR